MIKVTHIITRLTLGGAQETVFAYLFGLDKSKYNLSFLAGPDTDFLDKKIINKLDVNYIPSLTNSINIIKDLNAVWQIYKYLKHEKPNIVHTHSSKAGIVGRIAAKLAGVPFVIHTVHGWSFNDEMKAAKKIFYIMLERFAARLTTKLIAVTSKDIEKGLKYKIGTENQYELIRSGVDFEKFDSPDLSVIQDLKNHFGDSKIIGTVARISKQKNLIDFLKVAKLMLDTRNDLHFLIVGDGPLRKQVEEFINQNGLTKYVTLLGLRNDIPSLIYCFDVFLLTSLWEGLPRVVLEAMYCNVPVVANNVDGIAEIIEDGVNGFTVTPFDIQKSAHDVQILLEYLSIRESIIKNAKATVCNGFSMQSMLENTEKLYHNISSGSLSESSQWWGGT